MSYEKQNFVDDQILTANHLNHIEDGIVAIESDMKDLTLGLHTDGLLYIFKDGEPIGNGIAIMGEETGDVIGNVDSDNNIILYGNLQEGEYSVQYELEDGSIVTVGTLNIDGNDNTDTPIEPEEPDTPIEPEEPSAVVNLIPLSVDINGNEYVGSNGEDGYKQGYRINSSGNEVEADTYMSGFMPVELYDDIRVANFTHHSNPDGGFDKVVIYDKSKKFLGAISLLESNICVTIEEGEVYKTKPSSTVSGDVGFFRLCAGGITENTIVTVNQEIPSDYTDTPIEPEEGVNYFDVSTITLNSRLSSGGTTSAYNGIFVTDYIPVNADMEKQVFKISGIDLVLSTTYNYCSRIIYYNSDKTMVAANNNSDSIKEWSYLQPCFHGAGTENVNTSIAYVRISYVVKDNVEIAVDDVKNAVITTVDYYN